MARRAYSLLTVSFGQRSREAGSCHEWQQIGQKGARRKKNSVKWIERVSPLSLVTLYTLVVVVVYIRLSLFLSLFARVFSLLSSFFHPLQGHVSSVSLVREQPEFSHSFPTPLCFRTGGNSCVSSIFLCRVWLGWVTLSWGPGSL